MPARLSSCLMPFALALLLACGASTAHAQRAAQEPRAAIGAPSVLARGDAAAALPSGETVFFYNPAHLVQATEGGTRVTYLGFQGSATRGLGRQLGFAFRELRPALQDGFGTLPATEQNQLLRRASDLGGRQRTFVGGELQLPAVMARLGPVHVGAGAFVQSAVRYGFPKRSAEPDLDLVGQGDLTGVLTLGVGGETLRVPGLSLGLATKATQRYLTVKATPLLNLSYDETDGLTEGAYLFSGRAVTFDAGLVYDVTQHVELPGTLRFGAAAYDLAGTDFRYRYRATLAEGDAEGRIRSHDELLANARLGRLQTSWRAGLGYTLPIGWGPFHEAAFALDYVRRGAEPAASSLLTHVHTGAELTVGKVLMLRTGLAQGYTTAGVGLALGPVRLDYAFYGLEDGHTAGQLPSWRHQVRFAVVRR